VEVIRGLFGNKLHITIFEVVKSFVLRGRCANHSLLGVHGWSKQKRLVHLWRISSLAVVKPCALDALEDPPVVPL